MSRMSISAGSNPDAEDSDRASGDAVSVAVSRSNRFLKLSRANSSMPKDANSLRSTP